MFRPFCFECFQHNKSLDFNCITCDKLLAIALAFQAKQQEIHDIATVAAAEIIHRYGTLKGDELGVRINRNG